MSRLRRAAGYKKSEVSRSQVLDAAIAVLAKKGIAGTSVQDIADGAGLSKGAIHYHFESKDELLFRVLERCCEIVEVRLLGVFAEEGPPLERIRRVFTEMWRIRRDGIREMRVLTELHLLARQTPPLRKVFADAMRRVRTVILEKGLEALSSMGLRPKVSVDIIPRLFIALLDGLALQHELDPLSAETESEIINTLQLLTLALFEA